MKHFHVFTWLFYAISFTHAATTIQGTKGSGLQYARNASSASLLHAKKTPFGIQPQSLFARQEECPPGFPGTSSSFGQVCSMYQRFLLTWMNSPAELCPDDLCCEADTVCVSILNNHIQNTGNVLTNASATMQPAAQTTLLSVNQTDAVPPEI